MRRDFKEPARHRPDLVISAGFMKILGKRFLERFGGRLVNTHPALLPAFPGAHAVREGQLAAGLRPYAPVRYAMDGVALGVIAEPHAGTAVLLDGTNRAVAALRHGLRAIAVTVVRPVVTRPPAADVVPLPEVGVWAEKGPRRELFRNMREELFRPMPEILARAERDVLATLVEEERNGAEGLHVGRAGRLGAFDPAAP